LECVWAERTQFGPAHSDARPVNSNHAERFYGMLAVMRYPGEQWIAATRELTRRSLTSRVRVVHSGLLHLCMQLDHR
jgi:hypothetical protein